MKQENEFVLPKDWHVVATEENIDTLNNWRFGENNEYLTIGCFVGMVNGKKEWDDPKDDHFESKYFPNEITFDQFKEHVLKEMPKPEYDPKDVAFKNDVYSNSEFNSESKIIGYKLIKKEYLDAVNCICKRESREDKKFLLYNTIYVNSDYYLKIKYAEILHWFEPVFEEKKIKLTSGIELTEKDIEEVKEILKNK